MPYLLRSTSLPTGIILPVFVIANRTHIEHNDYDGDGNDEDEDFIEHDYSLSPITISSRNISTPMTSLSHLNTADRHIPSTSSIDDYGNNDDGRFRLLIDVNDFQADELNVSIRHGRLIVRGKHVVHAHNQIHAPLTTNSVLNDNEDREPDFFSKEFKRTFLIPPNADEERAHAQFHPQQHLLVVEIPFQNSSQIRTRQLHIRPIDVFLTLVYVLLMDRAIGVTYEQYMINEYSNYQTI